MANHSKPDRLDDLPTNIRQNNKTHQDIRLIVGITVWVIKVHSSIISETKRHQAQHFINNIGNIWCNKPVRPGNRFGKINNAKLETKNWSRLFRTVRKFL